MAGVNWATSIMALKFLSASGSGAISGAISCLDYAVSHGANTASSATVAVIAAPMTSEGRRKFIA